MKVTSRQFPEKAARAMEDENLQKALGVFADHFPLLRRHGLSTLPEFGELSRQAVEIKDRTLGHLDHYLELFTENAEAVGTHVHFASDAAAAREIIRDICLEKKARLVTKGKSMVSEEIGLNDELEAAGIEVVETDLGEYILQLAGETPSHIIAPAIHKSAKDVAALFAANHGDMGFDRSKGSGLLAEARSVLREKYFEADVAVTGANFLVAETGSVALVTNEGNGDMAMTLASTHIVVTGIEKVLPDLETLGLMLRLLARSATGQEITAYNTLMTGPKRAEDTDGPGEFHVVLLDNGRSKMLGGELEPLLRCFRCGSCMNHCPVYGAVGGHAYGWVYPGPIGAAFNPAILGLEETRHLVEASSLCGRCEEVCPLQIPLPAILRYWRRQAHESKIGKRRERWGVKAWSWLSRHPILYGWALGLAGWSMRIFSKAGRVRPFLLPDGWGAKRDLAAPRAGRFTRVWKKGQGDGHEG
ncbi:MAG: lactate utilization protein B [Sphingomonadales bacterium]